MLFLLLEIGKRSVHGCPLRSARSGRHDGPGPGPVPVRSYTPLNRCFGRQHGVRQNRPQ